MKHLTESIMSSVENQSIGIRDISDWLGIVDGQKVLVIGTRSEFLRIYPIAESEVVLVRVALTLEGFRTSARTIIDKMRTIDLHLIHSTGFCPLQDYCVWEGYFAISLRDKIEEFSDWVREQSPVIDIELKYLSSEQNPRNEG
ncbi:MAG: hypothetical protein BAJATHORv1_10351 [Candidatus Thorarchaeota archaeon]|nr:MAG: hypothetical protein BAJATHORv1_10351 [Candidatus Thorarchaeota archaeon]